MGDKASLCERCAANARSSLSGSSGGGAHIGAIRPALKVVRLKPGEPIPPEYARQAAAQAASEPAPFSREQPRFEAPRQEQRYEPVYVPQRRNRFTTFAGLALILGAAWGTVWVLRGESGSLLENEVQKEEQLRNDFSHIVIHEKEEIVVDGRKTVGSFSVDGDQIALTGVQALFSPKKNLLELKYFGEMPKEFKRWDAEHKKDEAIVTVFLQFSPLAGALDRDKLQSYMIELHSTKPPLRLVKTYSKQLASFGEVAPMNGALKEGEQVKGGLQDSRRTEREGQTINVGWHLTFQSPLKITP